MKEFEKALLAPLTDLHGLDTWKNYPQAHRDSVITLLEQNRIISPAQAYLLDWLPRNTYPNLADYTTFRNLLNTIRSRLIAIMDTQRPPETEAPPSTQRSAEITKIQPDPEESDDFKILSEEEITARFNKLGIDIQKTLSTWHDFYWRKNYGEYEFGTSYTLPMPTLTAEAMEALEEAWFQGDIDTIMIDDARLPDGKTLKYFQPRTSRKTVNTCNQFRPISPESMLDFLDGKIADFKKGATMTGEERRKLIRRYEQDDLDERGVRMIGIKTGISHLDYQRLSIDKAAEALTFNYTNIMEFGTWVRLLHFLHYSGSNYYNVFLDNISRLKSGVYYLEPEILLNTFTRFGEFVTATAYRNRIQYHTKATPGTNKANLMTHATPLVVIQSDSHPEEEIPF